MSRVEDSRRALECARVTVMTTAELSHTPTPFMKRLSPADAEALVRLGTARRVPHRQALGYEGQVPDRVFVLRSGWVKVCSTTPDGRDVILAVREPDDLVGELSALDGRPRSASMVALGPVEVVVISAARFRAFLDERPAAAVALLETLTDRLREADAGRVEHVELTTWGRLARRIVTAAERFGKPAGGAIEIGLFTQDDIAGWTGASLESVARALQMMRQLGWIQTGPRKIRVLDLEAIRRSGE
jgi:CRP/FNR family cyclic AMP-dependent transcriptional regulator